jgi:hypothetical protein
MSRLQRAIEDAYMRAGDADNPFERDHWLLIAGWLRELRARRTAMGRDADDERNGPADVTPQPDTCSSCGHWGQTLGVTGQPCEPEHASRGICGLWHHECAREWSCRDYKVTT